MEVEIGLEFQSPTGHGPVWERVGTLKFRMRSLNPQILLDSGPKVYSLLLVAALLEHDADGTALQHALLRISPLPP